MGSKIYNETSKPVKIDSILILEIDTNATKIIDLELERLANKYVR